jgi:glutathione synthase/RimK-type ligase-like ATP-grasp enzyme
LSNHIPDRAQVSRWRSLVGALRAWLESVPGHVANRGDAAAHNRSKPLHEYVLGRHGFSVPESITTSDARALVAFVRERPCISKTVCGVRADAVLVTEADFENFDPESGPVHVQHFIEGVDARVHVIGERIIALRTLTQAVDYRREVAIVDMKHFDVPPVLARSLVESTAALGLLFAGYDFKIDDAGRYWCLEANPMPGYHPYDRACAGAITRELVRTLGGEAP